MNNGYLRIVTKIDNKDVDAQLKQLEMKLEDTQTKIQATKKILSLTGKQAIGIDKEKAQRQLIELEAQAEKTRNAITKINNEKLNGIQKSIDKMGNSFGKSIKKMLRFGVAVIGVESVFTILSKAFNSNEEAVRKMENVWNGLGSILSPVIDWITDRFLYLIAIINEFIKQLTGIDYVAKANAEAIKDQANAQKELNRQMASFDEMNVVSQTTSTSGGGTEDSGQIELPQLSEDTINKIKNVADIVKEIWDNTEGLRKVIKKIIDFAVENPEVILAILGGVELTKWISRIIGVAGGTTGLLGIAAALTIIAGISIANLINEMEDFNKSVENVNKQTNLAKNNWNKLTDSVEDMTDANERFIKTTQALNSEVNNSAITASEYFEDLKGLKLMTDQTTGTFDKFKNTLIENLEVGESELNYLDTLYEKTEKNKDQTNSYVEYLKKYRDSLIQVNDNLSNNKVVSAKMGDVIESNKEKISALDEKINYLNGTLENNTDNMKDFGEETNESKSFVQRLIDTINNLKDKDVKINVDADTNKATSKLGQLFNNAISNPLNNIFDKLGLDFHIPKLATGGIVNNPGSGVMLGGYVAGEAGREGVIPLTDPNAMAQLGQEIGKWITSNNSTNVYLDGRLIQRQIDQKGEQLAFEKNGR